MAGAMVRGLLAGNQVAAGDIACTCGDDDTGAKLAESTGIGYLADAAELIDAVDTIVLACKPQQLAQLDATLAQAASGRLLLSILAGTTLSRIHGLFPGVRNIVRAMPNTPGQIGAGMTAYAPLQTLTDADQQAVEQLLGALGTVLKVPEAELDAVTAVSGSGPAYLFEFTAALREAAAAVGLDAETAHKLAMQTVIGSAKLLETSGEDPETLRNFVTSPNGTTEAALNQMKAAGFRNLITDAVSAAKRRSIELAQA